MRQWRPAFRRTFGRHQAAVVASEIDTRGCPPGECAAAGRKQQARQRSPTKTDDQARAGGHRGEVAFGIPLGVLIDLIPDAAFTSMLDEI